MIQNYLTSAWRFVARNKAFTGINLLGLVIGMTAFLLIFQFVLHELNYDSFWAQRERIYRVQLDRYDKGELSTRWASGAAGIGPDLKSAFPEVEAYVRMTKSNALLSNGDIFFKEGAVYYTSQDFFKVFGSTLVSGEDSTALKGPNKIVLSQTLAKKYFGSADPVGKTIRNNGSVEYQVTGVFKDFPAHSHLQIDALLSFATYVKLVGKKDETEMKEWMWDGFYTYVLLHENTSAKALEAKLPDFVQQKVGEQLKSFQAAMVFTLMPVMDIHLDSDFIGEFKSNGSRDSVYFLGVVALLIIVIAWINYINLSTTKSVERAREVGVRKVMGGFRQQLIQQFLIESLALNLTASVVAIAVVLLITPWFGQVVGRELGYELFLSPSFWLWALIVLLGGALLSGVYPAFVLSSFKPIDVLKGRFKNSGKGVLLRKGMVVAQFVASVTLMVGTFTVYQQLHFMRTQALGVQIDQTVVLPSPTLSDSLYTKKYEVFKNRLLNYPEVTGVCASTSIPGSSPNWNAGGIRRLSQREDEQKQYRVILVDHDFVSLYGLEIIAGRKFSGENAHEEKTVLLNEAAVRHMGFEKMDEAIDDHIFFWGDTFRIVGVLKNYRQESLKKAFEPLIFRYGKSPEGFYSIKFKTAAVQKSLHRFENDWKELFPGNPFNYYFLDDHYNQQYKADQQFGMVFGIFSGLAIFVACLGLFGLSSLNAVQRTKEIGVRKVMGASSTSILILVGRDYMVLLTLAIAIATPCASWVMGQWLQAFASPIALSWWIYAVPCVIVVIIALLTVSLHTWMVARTNPVTALRYE